MGKAVSIYATWILTILATSAVLVASYSGLHHSFYSDVFAFVLNRNLFQYDIYLQNSILPDASSFYKLVGLLHFPMNLNAYSFPVHLVIISVGLFYAYKIIFEVLEVKDSIIGCLFLITFCLHFSVLETGSVFDGIRYDHTVNQSWVAHVCIMPTLYYFFRKRLLLAGVILAAALSMTVRGYVILFPTLLLALLISKEFKNAAMFSLPVLGFILYTMASRDLGASLDFDSKLAIMETIIARTVEEDSFNLQPIAGIFRLLVMMVFYGCLVKFVPKGRVKNLLLSILIVSSALFIGAYLYTSVLYRYFPEPRLLFAGPVRAIFIFFVGFKLLLVSMFVGYAKKEHKFSVSVVLALMIAATYGSSSSVMMVTLVLILVALPLLNSKWLAQFRSQIVLALICFGLLYIGTKTIIGKDKLYHTFSEANQEPCVSYLKGIRGDFMLAELGMNAAQSIFILNARAEKSKYLGDVTHFFLNPKLIREHNRREGVINSLEASLRSGTPTSIGRSLGVDAPFLFLVPQQAAAHITDKYQYTVPSCGDKVLVASFGDENLKIGQSVDSQIQHQ